MRIGPRMNDVRNLVAANPGRTMLWYAERVGPNGSRRFGYASVHRAIKAGIVRGEVCPRNKGWTILLPVSK